ncbi:MAG: phenylacetyl-CoA:acceptor oxidoreductase [Woeseiaceae bacterium]
MSAGGASHVQQFWDTRAACNFIGGGTGTGLLVFAAVGAATGLPYLLLAFVALGLTMVWFEIGKPLRAFNVFLRPQTSWMSRESIAAVLLFLIGAVALASASPGVPALLTALTALAFLACQLGMLYAVRGIPAWRERTVMPLVGLSGLAEGGGLYLMLMALGGRVLPSMLFIALGLIIARALAWQVYLNALDRGRVPRPSMAAFDRIRGAFLLLGHGLPALLVVAALLRPQQAGALAALAGAGVTLAGWLLKLVLITRAAHTRGISVPAIPVRGESVTPVSTS